MKIFILLITLSVKSVLIVAFYLPKIPSGDDTAEEIQHAVCKITSKELQATANATITRQLKGVCTSSYVQDSLDKLQTKLLHEIETIKNILQTNGFIIPQSKIESHEQTNGFIIPQSKAEIHENFHGYLIQKTFVNENSFQSNTETHRHLMTKSSKQEPLRAAEIAKYNNTVVDSSKGSIYYYYWEIHNIKKLLKKKEMYKSSPDFYVLGHTLHLQIYPNYLEENCFGILLRPSSNGFLKKHRIFLLNQLRENLDINSGILYGFRSEDKMFTISQGAIGGKGFIYNDNMLINLELLLNS